MRIEAAQRVREGLAELIRFVNDADASTAAARRVLEDSKAFGAQVAVLQADAAALVAKRDRHGDGGVGVLAQAAGLSRRDAVSQVKTVEILQSMPSARDALASGEISVANARTLVTACERTSAEQVEQDDGLLAQAAMLSPDQFTREARRWAAKRQEDDGEERYRRQRARRRLSFWDGDDGMVHLRGELDPVTGAKVRKRFVQESERLRRADLRSPGGDTRSLNQRMADALDTLTSHGSIYSNAEHAASARDNRRDSAGNAVSGTNHASGARGGDTSRENAWGDRSDSADAGRGGGPGEVDRGAGARGGEAGGVDRGGGARCGCSGRLSADITIVQHLSADGTEAFAEVAGGGVIPQSVLEEYFCDARITGVVFSSEGVPLWHGHTKRLATKAQMNALRARYGACGGCGADMWVCQGHHVEAVSRGGPTNVDNMMLVCWACHQKIHHHGWREVPDGRGLYTIAPPERIRHGPARAPDPPPGHEPRRSHAVARAGPPPEHEPRRSHAAPRGDSAAVVRPASASAEQAEPRPRAWQAEPLFTTA